MKAKKMPMGFDSLEYAHQLEKAGFTKVQAEGQTRAQQVMIAGLTDSYLATKSDIAEVRGELQEVHAGLKAEIQEVRTEIQEVRLELKGIGVQISRGVVTVLLGVTALLGVGLTIQGVLFH